MRIFSVAQSMMICACLLVIAGCGSASNASTAQLAPAAAPPTVPAHPTVMPARPAPTPTAVPAPTDVPATPSPAADLAPTAIVSEPSDTRADVLWSFTADRAPCSDVRVSNKLVYGICGVADTFGVSDAAHAAVLYVLDRRTGAERWRLPANWFALGAHLVYAPCESNRAVCAFEPSSGQVHWRQPVQYGSSAFVSEIDGVAYIGGGMTEGAVDPSVVAVDAQVGKPLWQFSRGDGVRSGGALVEVAVTQQQIYLVTSDQQLHALDRASGSLQWSATIGPQLHAPAVVGDVVYALAADALLALDRATGQERGRLPLSLPGSNRVSLQAIGHQLLIWAANGKIIAVDLAGRKLLWEDQPSPEIDPSALANRAFRDRVEYRGEAAGMITASSTAGSYAASDWMSLRTFSVANGGIFARSRVSRRLTSSGRCALAIGWWCSISSLAANSFGIA